MRLEKIWRNAIIEAVQAGGLDPRDFDFDFGDEETRITHRWSESYFLLGGPWGKWEGEYVVGDNVPWPPYREYAWPNVEKRVEQWAAKASFLRTRYTAFSGWPFTASSTSSAGVGRRLWSSRRLPNRGHAS